MFTETAYRDSVTPSFINLINQEATYAFMFTFKCILCGENLSFAINGRYHRVSDFNVAEQPLSGIQNLLYTIIHSNIIN